LAAAAGGQLGCVVGQIVKVIAPLVPPPPPPLQFTTHPAGAGEGPLKTVTVAVPCALIKHCDTLTTICVAEIDVVVMYAGSVQTAGGLGTACGADE
jgi:hypothetical protein